MRERELSKDSFRFYFNYSSPAIVHSRWLFISPDAKKGENMYTSGLDYFCMSPGEKTEMKCKVCGEVCEVRRNVDGPTCFAEAMAQRHHLHDEFWCPNARLEGHQTALELVDKIAACPSDTLRSIFKNDLAALLPKIAKNDGPSTGENNEHS
jgi:hypothetical protein